MKWTKRILIRSIVMAFAKLLPQSFLKEEIVKNHLSTPVMLAIYNFEHRQGIKRYLTTAYIYKSLKILDYEPKLIIANEGIVCVFTEGDRWAFIDSSSSYKTFDSYEDIVDYYNGEILEPKFNSNT